jgi:hypothetical protein
MPELKPYMTMKRFIRFIFIALSLVCIQTAAQESALGLKGGLNFSNLNGDDISGTDGKFVYHVGGFARVGITDFVALQPEAIYSLKGADSDQGDLRLSYIDVPILAKLYLSDHLNLHAGPQFGILLNAESDFNGITTDVKEQYSTLDFAAAAGLEYELSMGLVFGARYHLSLSSIGEDYESSVTVNGVTSTVEVEAADVRNGVMQVYMGFTF